MLTSYLCVFKAFSTLNGVMQEHAEIFWSLFAVDMDTVLKLQPTDTWDSFRLYVNLNDYLREDGWCTTSPTFPYFYRECPLGWDWEQWCINNGVDKGPTGVKYSLKNQCTL